MLRFENKVAVVTGAGQGIGAATALRLAREGANVQILDLRLDTAQASAENINADSEVREAGGSATAWECDVTDAEKVAEVFAAIHNKTNRIDVLINNAGITRDNMFFKMSSADWQSVLDTNLTSVFNCTKEAQKYMVEAKYGRIVNLSSRSAMGNRGQANYAAAKAGIKGLTATLAIELGPFNIGVNAVAPGYIATAMTAATAERVGSTASEHQEYAAANTPLRRVGQPEEVAALIAFLASDDASYVSGETISINGGAR